MVGWLLVPLFVFLVGGGGDGAWWQKDHFNPVTTDMVSVNDSCVVSRSFWKHPAEGGGSHVFLRLDNDTDVPPQSFFLALDDGSTTSLMKFSWAGQEKDKFLIYYNVTDGVDEPLGSVTLGFNEWQALWVSGSTLTVQEVGSAMSTKVSLPSTTQQEYQARGRGITVNVTSSRGNVYLIFSCQTGCVVFRTPMAEDAFTPVPLEGHRDLWVWVPELNQTLLQVVLFITQSQNITITQLSLSFSHCWSSSWTRLRVARMNKTDGVGVWSVDGGHLKPLNATDPSVTIRPDYQVSFSFQSTDTALWSLGCDTRLAKMQDLWSTRIVSTPWVLLACVLFFSLLLGTGSVYTWHICKRSHSNRQDDLPQPQPKTLFSWWYMGSVSIREDVPRARPTVMAWSPVARKAEAVPREKEGTSHENEGAQRSKKAEENDLSSGAVGQVKSLRGENSLIGRENLSLGRNNSASGSNDSHTRQKDSSERKVGCSDAITEEAGNQGFKNLASGLEGGTFGCNNDFDHNGSPSAFKNSPKDNKYGFSECKIVGPEHKHAAHSCMDTLDGRSGVPPGKKDITKKKKVGSNRHSGHTLLQEDHPSFTQSIETQGRSKDINKTQNAQTRNSDKDGHDDTNIQSSQRIKCATVKNHGRPAVEDQQPHGKWDVASAGRRKKKGGECKTENDTRMFTKDEKGSKFRGQHRSRSEESNGDVDSTSNIIAQNHVFIHPQDFNNSGVQDTEEKKKLPSLMPQQKKDNSSTEDKRQEREALEQPSFQKWTKKKTSSLSAQKGKKEPRNWVVPSLSHSGVSSNYSLVLPRSLQSTLERQATSQPLSLVSKDPLPSQTSLSRFSSVKKQKHNSSSYILARTPKLFQNRSTNTSVDPSCYDENSTSKHQILGQLTDKHSLECPHTPSSISRQPPEIQPPPSPRSQVLDKSLPQSANLDTVSIGRPEVPNDQEILYDELEYS